MPSPSDDPAREKQLRMLRALDEAAAKLEAIERDRTEPIAIIGAGCRFPGGARDIEAYWRLLALGVDATGDMPLDRWDIDALYNPNPDVPGTICTRRGAFLPEIDRFDAEHFNISPREANTLDPQHRLLLEVAHEALDSAGQLNDRLAVNLTGVFIGVTNNDYAHLLREYKADRPLDAYFITGNAPNGAAGRLSYQLGLRGPSLVVDTACSSSLTSVQLACQSLRQRECHLALAGGVNLLVMPDTYTALSRARLLAADGRCKTFDAAADGYGRGEGGGLIVLKRLSDACRDGDTILATIRGGAINHDGPSSGFTVPNGSAQRTLLQQALAASKLTPADVDYIEAHGTGTTLGDPIEVNALVDIFCEGRTAANPLLLGSVKTNLGHLESGAGIAGILKVALSLWHRQLPRHLHFKNPTPRIPWADIPVKVTAEHTAWADPGRPRRAGISSFGVSGTNVHLILEESPTGVESRTTLPLPKKQLRGRHRYWAFARPQYVTARNWLHRVDWIPQPRRERATTEIVFSPPAAAAAVATWATNAAARYAGKGYATILPELEQLAGAYASEAVAALTDPTKIASRHARLWTRLQSIAARTAPGGNANERADRLLAAQPEAATEIKLLQRCGENLSAVLRGEIDPLTLLFPANETPTAADLYGANPVARALNDTIATWLAAVAPTGQKLRVLEIGAGTGATTATALAALAGCDLDYTFTDVSPLFLAQAAKRFRDHSGITFRVLDIENDPLAQDFASGEFDLIIAANVMHATRDLATTLQHTRRLLATGGQLALIELTAPLAFLDLVFGLTEGWWRFTDTNLRPTHPLLAPTAWTALLERHGFTAAAAHSFPPSTGAIFRQQAVFTATASGDTSIAKKLTGRWLFIGDTDLTFDQSEATIVTTSADDLSPLDASEPWTGVVHLPSAVDDPLNETPLRTALAIAHALIEKPAPWWIVTRGAISVADNDAVPQLAAAGLWGFARTVVQEHPELNVRRLDLDPTTDTATFSKHLVSELTSPSTEDQLAWRGTSRFAARLVSANAPEPAGNFQVSPDRTVLVVGGLGGLGLSLAHWLAECGAKHVVLASRRPPTASAQAEIKRLEVVGLTVRTMQLDVASSVDVTRVLADIATTGPQLGGIIHAAGVLDDGSLQQLNWSRFQPVLAPKVSGAWQLHHQTLGQSLDFFVFFSSSTALLGTPGQANHAAANAWLDALAQHRRAAGLPAVSINWGPWAEIGAAARRGVAEHARRHGLATITAAKGWHLLGEILQGQATQVAVLPMNWAEAPASLTRSAFYDSVRVSLDAQPSVTEPSAASTPATIDWATLPLATRSTRLRELIRGEVASVLALDGATAVDPTKGFFALGMDSLTSVELRNRLQTQLGRTLPSTLIFDHASVDALTSHLAKSFDPVAATASAPLAVKAPVNRDLENVCGDELSNLLENELKDL